MKTCRPHRAASILPLETRRLLAVLVSGEVATGTIASQTDSYTINVDAGTAFVVAVHDTSSSSFTPRIVVTGPGGGTLLNQSDTEGLATVIPTATSGTYTIDISADSGSGNYSLVGYRSAVAADDDDLVEGASGRRFAKTLEVGDVATFTLDATSGQSISATVTENNAGNAIDPRAAIIAPNGRIVQNLTNEQGVRVEDRAAENGRYYIVVTDEGNNDAGILGISTTQVPGTQYPGDPDTAPLASGVTRLGDLPGGDMDVIQIPNVGVGDNVAVTISAAAGSLDPDIVLYDPNGAALERGTRSNGNATSSLSTTASVAGTYWVVIRDFESDDGGQFNIRYDLTSGGGTDPDINNGVLRVDGTDADDTITIARTGGLLVVTINGEADQHIASDVNRIDLYAGGGSDYIDMRESDIATYVSAGSGDDSVLGGSGNDSLTGGAGRNRLYGGLGIDRLRGSGGRDFLYGEGDSDRLYGEGGNDYIDGGGGTDRLYGGDGDDLLQGGSSNDRMYAQAGNDILIGSRGNDLLNGDIGTDRTIAKEDGDTLISIESAG